MAKTPAERLALNPFQGSFKRVLCVCTGGALRSPTAAEVLSQSPYNFNTRSAGIRPDAIIHASDTLVRVWAQEIVCMEWDHFKFLKSVRMATAPVHCLEIPDDYDFRDPTLQRLIRIKYERVTR